MDPDSILVRSVNWLGDAVMSSPTLQRLREARPNTRITLLTPAKIADLWRHHPAIDDLITLNPTDNPWTVARRLQSRKFSHALILPNSHRAALEVRLAGIPIRLGFARPWRNWLLTRTLPAAEPVMTKRSLKDIHASMSMSRTSGKMEPAYPAQAHHVFHYLRLLQTLDIHAEPSAPVMAVSEAEIQALRQRLGADLNAAPFWLGLNPGAEYGPAKRWPADRFAAAARAIHQATGAGWVLFGGGNDAELCRTIEQSLKGPPAVPCINLAGRTTLRELAAGMTLCRVFLTNDTGPMHLAAALGTPVVALFGSTSPELTRPGHPLEVARPHKVVQAHAGCSPCFLRKCPIDLRCLGRITVDQTVAAVLQTLD